MKALFIFNAAPYGDERAYNGMRFASVIARRTHDEVRAFLMGDAVGAAKQGQKVPEGFYNMQLMIDRVARSSTGNVGVCATCMDARGIPVNELTDGTHRSSLEELADWSEWADKVFVF